VAAGVFAQFGMSGGAFVALALVALLALRLVEQPRSWWNWRRLFVAILLLAVLAVLLRHHVPEHDVLRARSRAEFLRTFGLGLAWPYPGNALMAFVANAPFVTWVVLRIAKHESASHTDDFIVTIALFSLGAALAQAICRGGGPEFGYTIP
jgi:MFS family permease